MADKKINKIKPNLGNTKPMNNVPKVNPYWIYGVIIIAFLAIQWFTLGAGPVETNWMEVKNTMLQSNDIKKIIVINREEAQIYLKETSYDKYTEKLKNGFTAPAKIGPHFFFTIGSVETFEASLQEAQESLSPDNKISVEYKTVHNYLGELLNWILPFAIIILIWWFIFKRMSKGAGGGGAGNIFNVGKSQAKVFDKDSRVSTNFKDVAGLAEAKQEVEE
ncbi:MAG: ATP-dependent metallopeptidase FtsH/Yme1/Tma family protein, partial [Bacteroidota bacterium]|nr:ATP-dependent metallopeptidase FtsH/Yme1/Tma family protein [Bacteroidota bacterium]